MNKVSDINYISRFTISTLSGSSGKVYANGRQQVQVYITLKFADANHNVVVLDGDELKKIKDSITLCDYITGEPLVNIPLLLPFYQKWAFTENDNGYTPFSVAASLSTVYSNNGTIVIPYYIACPEAHVSPTINVAASIKLEQLEVDTRGDDGFDSYVTIHAVKPANYKFSTGSLKLIEESVFNRRGGQYDYHEFGKIYKVVALLNNQEVRLNFMSKTVETVTVPAAFSKISCDVNHSLGGTCDKHDAYFSSLMKHCFKDRAYTSNYLSSWYVSKDGDSRNLFYDFSGKNVSGYYTLGVGGYNDYFPVYNTKNRFCFAVTRRQTWECDDKSMDDYITKNKYSFVDEYGNNGSFFAVIGNYYDMNNDHHINSDWKFYDA
ncbi:hypothetical protein J2X14_002691 [Pantoea alhagi]|uniref:hypothetical protein n=1 Tax=Mixta sp. BE291 TaxID=3158787 RepID=UPI00285BE9C1|nr:hypothetical protein [Pantoea alhagi]